MPQHKVCGFCFGNPASEYYTELCLSDTDQAVNVATVKWVFNRCLNCNCLVWVLPQKSASEAFRWEIGSKLPPALQKPDRIKHLNCCGFYLYRTTVNDSRSFAEGTESGETSFYFFHVFFPCNLARFSVLGVSGGSLIPNKSGMK